MSTTKYDVWREATLLFHKEPDLSLTKFEYELFKKFKGLITRGQMSDALKRHPEIAFVRDGPNGRMPQAMNLRDVIHRTPLKYSNIALL